MPQELNEKAPFSGGAHRSERMFNFLNTFFIPALMGVYVFVNPFHLTALSQICFYLSILALLILISFKKVTFSLRSPLTLPFLLFFLWAIFGLLFTLDVSNTLHDLRTRLLNYLIFFYLLINYYSTQKRLEVLSVIFIASATIFSLGTVISYYFIDGYPFSSRLGIGANFTDMPAINIGFIALPATILAFNRLQNSGTKIQALLFSLTILILILTSFLTQSRGTLLGLFAGLATLCFMNRKILFVLIGVLILTALVPNLAERFNFKRSINDERNKTNHLAVEVIKSYPITGVGFGMQIYTNPNLINLEKLNSQFAVEYQQANVISYPHSTPLDIAVRTGIIGLVLFLGILFVSLLLLWKTYIAAKNRYLRSWSVYVAAAMVSYLVPALFTDTTFGPKAIVFYIMLAMVAILWNLVRDEQARGNITRPSPSFSSL